MEKVSIVIPSYNHEPYIHKAILSALQQTYKNIEIIIIDDGSKDNSVNICKKVAQNNQRIKIIVHKNFGAHNAINEGIKLATGKYIAILNSDDVFKKNKIERCIEIINKNPQTELVFGDIEFINSQGQLESNAKLINWRNEALEFFKESKLLALSILNENILITTSNLFFTKKIWKKVEGFQPLQYCHDLDFIISALQKCKYFYDNKIHIQYRIHETNTIKDSLYKVQVEVAAVSAVALIDNNTKLLGESLEKKIQYFQKYLKHRNLSDLIVFCMMQYKKHCNKKYFYQYIGNEETKKILSSLIPKRHQTITSLIKKIFNKNRKVFLKNNNNRINLLIEVSSFDKGGLQQVILDQALLFDKKKINPIIVNINQAGYLSKLAESRGIKVYNINGFFCRQKKYAKIIKKENISLSCSHFSNFGYPILKKYNIPNITFIHNVYAFLSSDILQQFKNNDQYVDQYISVSKKATLYTTKKIGIQERKITTISNGLNVEDHLIREKNIKKIKRQDFGLKSNDYVFLNVASYNLHKGHYLMADAMHKILTKRKDIKILCIGNVINPVHIDKLKEFLISNNLDKNIIMPGYFPNVESFYNIADAFLLPSFIEGWSIAMNEAMFYGKPMILTDTGASAEVINNNDIGILLKNEYGDITNLDSQKLDFLAYKQKRFNTAKDLALAMEKFADNRSYWEKAGKKGREKVIKDFDLKNTIKKYQEIFFRYN